MMELYFFRHGIAAERTEYAHDAERPLIPKGERRSRQVAQRLRDLGLEFDAILTSPLLRARQTANILHEVRLGDAPQLFPSLAPGGSLAEFWDWLAQWQPSALDPKLVLVGHQPDLGAWAEEIAFEQSGNHLVLKKAGIIGIRTDAPRMRRDTHNELFLLTSPKWLL